MGGKLGFRDEDMVEGRGFGRGLVVGRVEFIRELVLGFLSGRYLVWLWIRLLVFC